MAPGCRPHAHAHIQYTQHTCTAHARNSHMVFTHAHTNAAHTDSPTAPVHSNTQKCRHTQHTRTKPPAQHTRHTQRHTHMHPLLHAHTYPRTPVPTTRGPKAHTSTQMHITTQASVLQLKTHPVHAHTPGAQAPEHTPHTWAHRRLQTLPHGSTRPEAPRSPGKEPLSRLAGGDDGPRVTAAAATPKPAARGQDTPRALPAAPHPRVQGPLRPGAHPALPAASVSRGPPPVHLHPPPACASLSEQRLPPGGQPGPPSPS